MYIKLKHIKQFILIAICVFFAGLNYLTYADTDNSTASNTVVCNKAADSDCDGLINTEEKLYGTNIDNPDTDSDGYSDGIEVKSGYDPLKPAPEDRLAKKSSAAASSNQASNTSSPTDTYAQSIVNLIEEKGDQPISTTDINALADKQLSSSMGDPITLDTLPAVDRSQIKILKQDYAGLSSEDRKQKELEDAKKYFQQMGYLFVSNSPTPILTSADFSAFQEDLLSHLTEISDPSVSLEYFSDLGNRLEVFLNQTNDVEVPETIVDLHIKFLRLSKGLLALRDSSQADASDPLERLLIISKAQTYANLFSDFFQNDFQNYFKNFQ